MPSKSKTKGSSFEREVSNFLSELYEDSFIRVKDSGAFTGGRNVVRKGSLTEGQIRAAKGDIVPPDQWRHFNCECKSYKEFPFHQLFSSGPIALLEEWIEQTLEAADTGDFNFIIMKFNRKGRYIAYQLEPLGTPFQTIRHLDYTDKNDNVWRFTSFDDFIGLNTDLFKDTCTGTGHQA